MIEMADQLEMTLDPILLGEDHSDHPPSSPKII